MSTDKPVGKFGVVIARRRKDVQSIVGHVAFMESEAGGMHPRSARCLQKPAWNLGVHRGELCGLHC